MQLEPYSLLFLFLAVVFSILWSLISRSMLAGRARKKQKEAARQAALSARGSSSGAAGSQGPRAR